MFKKTLASLILGAGILFSNNKLKSAEIPFPYHQDFESCQIGEEFSGWDFVVNPKVYGNGINPFGKDTGFDSRYIFITGWGGQGTNLSFPEIKNNLNFSCDFISIPDSGAHRGGFELGIKGVPEINTYRMGRWIGLEADAEIWQNYTDIYVNPYWRDSIEPKNKPKKELIGSLNHNEKYHLNLNMNHGKFSLNLTNPSTNIAYFWDYQMNFPIDSVYISHGSVRDYEYGLAIDNINITPEPLEFLLLGSGLSFLRKKKKN